MADYYNPISSPTPTPTKGETLGTLAGFGSPDLYSPTDPIGTTAGFGSPALLNQNQLQQQESQIGTTAGFGAPAETPSAPSEYGLPPTSPIEAAPAPIPSGIPVPGSQPHTSGPAPTSLPPDIFSGRVPPSPFPTNAKPGLRTAPGLLTAPGLRTAPGLLTAPGLQGAPGYRRAMGFPQSMPPKSRVRPTAAPPARPMSRPSGGGYSRTGGILNPQQQALMAAMNNTGGMRYR